MISRCTGTVNSNVRCLGEGTYLISALPDHSDVEAACELHKDAVAEALTKASGRPARVMPNFDVAEFAAYVMGDSPA